jgi:hypothetical protein
LKRLAKSRSKLANKTTESRKYLLVVGKQQRCQKSARLEGSRELGTRENLRNVERSCEVERS